MATKKVVEKKKTKKEIKEEQDKKRDHIIKTLEMFHGGPKTLGQKASDKLTKWAGSWTFIISFFVFLGLWMAANVLMWVQKWDAYPFILLNLVLSCVAAIQAPIILMSQNRQTQRDRLKAEYDYRINRKAEQEIREIRNLLRRKFKKK